MMPAETLINLRDICHVYTLGGHPVHALGPVSFSISRGEFVAITGPSGSGKSTLLYILGLLERPTAGSYELAGRDVNSLGAGELSILRNSTIGFIFQTFHLLPQHDVMGNVALPFLYRDTSESESMRACQNAIERVGLSHRMKHRPSELSGGEMQRVAIARALVGNPKLILADEPTGNLDSETGKEILGILGELHNSGSTILLITHDPTIAGKIPRRIALRDGIIVDDIK